MGLLSFLFGSKSSAQRVKGSLLIRGEGDFLFDIVGEANYQDILDAACGGKCEDGHEKLVAISLIPEPTNKYDRNAVRAVLAGHTVGYLSRADARDYLAELAAAGFAGFDAQCWAHITGGWKRSRSEGHYGVKLDIEMPPDFVFAPD